MYLSSHLCFQARMSDESQLSPHQDCKVLNEYLLDASLILLSNVSLLGVYSPEGVPV